LCFACAVERATAMKSSTAKLIERDFVAPDLGRIRRFIAEAVAEG
jgi:hypothetical protein